MRETRIKNQMDLQFFFSEITHGCNINREQEQIFMFKLYLKFPGTAEKQSQRQRPEMAEAPLTLLWGRCFSTAYKSATSKRGRHSCQECRFQPLGCFQHLVCILKSCTRTEPTESHRRAGRQSCHGASVRSQTRGGGHRESLSPAALPPSHHGSHLPPACLQLPKNGVANPSQGAEASQHPTHVHNATRYAIRLERWAKSTDIQQEHTQNHNSTASDGTGSRVTLWYTAVTQALVQQLLCPLPVADFTRELAATTERLSTKAALGQKDTQAREACKSILFSQGDVTDPGTFS